MRTDVLVGCSLAVFAAAPLNAQTTEEPISPESEALRAAVERTLKVSEGPFVWVKGGDVFKEKDGSTLTCGLVSINNRAKLFFIKSPKGQHQSIIEPDVTEGVFRAMGCLRDGGMRFGR